MNACDIDRLEQISLLIDGMLEPDRESELCAHLSHCPGCTAVFNDLSVMRAELNSIEDLEPPAALIRGVMCRVKTERRRGIVRFLSVRPFTVTAAAIVVLMLSVYYWMPKPPSSSVPPDAVADIVATQESAIYDISPQDGESADENMMFSIAGDEGTGSTTAEDLPADAEALASDAGILSSVYSMPETPLEMTDPDTTGDHKADVLSILSYDSLYAKIIVLTTAAVPESLSSYERVTDGANILIVCTDPPMDELTEGFPDLLIIDDAQMSRNIDSTKEDVLIIIKTE